MTATDAARLVEIVRDAILCPTAWDDLVQEWEDSFDAHDGDRMTRARPAWAEERARNIVQAVLLEEACRGD